MPGEECSKQTHCSFRWFIPESAGHLSSNKLTNDMAIPVLLPQDNITEDDNVTDVDNIPVLQPCAPNTWLWIVDDGEKGEAHFVLEDDIINVSVI